MRGGQVEEGEHRGSIKGGGSTGEEGAHREEGEHIWKFPCFPLGLLKNHQSAERVVVLWEGVTPSVPTCL